MHARARGVRGLLKQVMGRRLGRETLTDSVRPAGTIQAAVPVFPFVGLKGAKREELWDNWLTFDLRPSLLLSAPSWVGADTGGGEDDPH